MSANIRFKKSEIEKWIIFWVKSYCFVILFLDTSPTFAQVISIPGDYSTIQAGIDAANEGDTILVHPGTYNESILISGKNITIGSFYLTTKDPSYIPLTVIDGNNIIQNNYDLAIVRFNNNLDSNTVFSGFTITNMVTAGEDVLPGGEFNDTYYARGILISDCSPTVDGVWIYNNSQFTNYIGSGVKINNSHSNVFNILVSTKNNQIFRGMEIVNSNVNLRNITLAYNSGDEQGGGINIYLSTVSITNSIIGHNYVTAYLGYGGGIHLIESNLFLNKVILNSNKSSPAGNGCGGIQMQEKSKVEILNSVLSENYQGNYNRNNLESSLNAFITTDTNSIIIANSCILGGKNSISTYPDSLHEVSYFGVIIDEDPQFVNAVEFNYNLSDSSPCKNSGLQETFIVNNVGDTIYFPLFDLVLDNINIGIDPYFFSTMPDTNLISEIYDKFDPILVSNYKLSQNYPNPFNPTTKIKYSIPSNRKSETVSVKLVVYNVLGKEVATLVNKEQFAGSYEVEFNANNLSSGIYFYRLQTGSFVESKKMLLLQ